MTTAEAIAAANRNLAGTEWANYFSPQQPAFFLEAARSAGVSGPPFDAQGVAKIAHAVVANMQGMEDQEAADAKLNKEIGPESALHVMDAFDQMCKEFGPKADDVVGPNDPWFLYHAAAKIGVTIHHYYNRNEPDNQYDYILASDYDRLSDEVFKEFNEALAGEDIDV